MTRYTLLIILFFHTLGFSQKAFDQLLDSGYEQLIDGDFAKALLKLEQAQQLLPQKLPLEEKAVFFNNLGVAYYQTGAYKKGIDCYKTAVGYYRTMKNDSLFAESVCNLGLAYKEIGLYENATRELIRAARIFEREHYLQALSSTWNALGNIQREISNYEKALDYHQRALNIRKAIGYEKGVADSYHNIGYLYFKWKEYEKARTTLEEALDYKRKLGNPANLLTTLTLLGEVYLLKHRPEKAATCFNEAYYLRQKSNNSAKIAFSLLYLGNYYKSLGHRLKAYETYRQAQQLARTANDFPVLAEALAGEISLLRIDGDNDLLIKRYEELLQLREQLVQDANRKELARLEIDYDVDRKTSELKVRRKQNRLDKMNIENQRLRNQALMTGLVLSVALVITVIFALFWLKQRNRRIKEQNRYLDLQKQEITDLHQELSHRTKNYFSMLSRILKSDLRNAKHEETKRVLDENIHRMRAMSMVQHFLLDDSTKRHSEVQLDSYLNHLTDELLLHLVPNESTVRVHKHFTPLHVEYNKAVRIALVLNELICNVIEHGLPETIKPELFITVDRQDQTLLLTVRDNGPGISEEKLTTTGKGSNLIKKILHSIDGTVTYNNRNGCLVNVKINL